MNQSKTSFSSVKLEPASKTPGQPQTKIDEMKAKKAIISQPN